MENKKKGTGLAITGLILILPTTIIGMIFSAIALGKSIKTKNNTGIALSITGLVTGFFRDIIFIFYILPMLLYVIFVIIAIIFGLFASIIDYNVKKEEIKPIEKAIKENVTIKDDEIQIRDYHFKVDKY